MSYGDKIRIYCRDEIAQNWPDSPLQPTVLLAPKTTYYRTCITPNTCFCIVAGENRLFWLKLYDLKVVILKKPSLIYKVDILQNAVWKHSTIVYNKK